MRICYFFVRKAIAGKSKSPAATSVIYNAVFAKGKYDPEDWEMVRSWRFDHDAEFIQLSNCIQNRVPEGLTDEELQGEKGYPGYAIMLLKQRFTGNNVITCNMEFDYRMAPGIIIAYEPVAAADGKPELRGEKY